MVVMFNAIYSPSPVAVGTAQGFLLVVLSNFDMFWVLGSGFWVLGSGFWILGSGFWVLDSGF